METALALLGFIVAATVTYFLIEWKEAREPRRSASDVRPSGDDTH